MLLAPDFLVAEVSYGFLENIVTPLSANETFRMAAAVDPRGRQASLVWSEHQVTAADTDGEPRDEYSRPLRLLSGFFCVNSDVVNPSDTDLAYARDVALATYRRFLADEEGFAIEASSPFELASRLAGVGGKIEGRRTTTDLPSRQQRVLEPSPTPGTFIASRSRGTKASWVARGALIVAVIVTAVVTVYVFSGPAGCPGGQEPVHTAMIEKNVPANGRKVQVRFTERLDTKNRLSTLIDGSAFLVRVGQPDARGRVLLTFVEATVDRPLRKGTEIRVCG